MKVKINFKEHIGNIVISKDCIGDMMNDITEFSSKDYYLIGDSIVDSDGEIVLFEDIILGCIDTLNKQIFNSKHSELQGKVLENAKLSLKYFKMNLLNYAICPKCGKKLEIANQNLAVQPQYDLDLSIKSYKVKCTSCDYSAVT